MLFYSPEYPWEGHRIVYLILKIAAATPVDADSSLFGFIGHDFGVGVGQGEDDGFFIHVTNVGAIEEVSFGYSYKHIGIEEDFLQIAILNVEVGISSQKLLLWIHVILPPFIYCPLRIAYDDPFAPVVDQQFGYSHPRSSSPIHYYLALHYTSISHFQCVYQSCKNHYCSAMLVVVENRQKFQRFQPCLDGKALWSLDVLQIDGLKVP